MDFIYLLSYSVVSALRSVSWGSKYVDYIKGPQQYSFLFFFLITAIKECV